MPREPIPRAAGPSSISRKPHLSGAGEPRPITVLLPSRRLEPTRYRVAGRAVVANRPVAALTPFLARSDEAGALAREPPRRAGAAPLGEPLEIEVDLAGGRRWARLAEENGSLRWDFEGLGTLRTTSDGTWVDARELTSGLPEDWVAEVALGPGLIVALALHGTLCFHASAAVRNDSAVALLGESGRGKSTLAEHLRRLGWIRLADDVLPLDLSSGEVRGLADFPQLKLRPAEQPVLSLVSTGLSAVVVLREAGSCELEARRLSTADAAAAFLRHTVASRLFPRCLLRHHLALCGELAESVPVVELRYPLRPEVLARAGRRVAELVAG